MSRCPVSREFDPESGPSVGELHRVLARARAEEPIFFWEPLRAWVVTRYDDVKEILEDVEHFTLEGTMEMAQSGFPPQVTEILHGGTGKLGLTPQLGASDGPDHSRLREAIHRSFTPRRVRLLEPGIRSIIDERIDAMLGRREADFIQALAYPVPIRVIFLLAGFPAKDMDQLKHWAHDLAHLLATPLPVEEQVRCSRSQRAFEEYVEAVLEDRRKHPGDDFMSDLLRSIDAGECEIDQAELVILFTVNLLMAGHETTTYSMANMMYHLLSEPDRWSGVLDDRSSIPAVVNESLRFDPPNIGWWRIVSKDTTFRGIDLEQGDQIFWLLASANRDAARFDRPDEFDITRAKDHSMTFGFGAHYCLGAQLAKLELQLLLEHLANRMPNLALTEPQDISYDRSPVMRHMRELRVTF